MHRCFPSLNTCYLPTQVLVTAHYTSYLVSSMAVGPALPTVSTIADISRHPRLRLSFIKGSSVTEYFRVCGKLV